jgi:hypothetical protein
MSETAWALYIDNIDKLNYNDFVNFIKKNESNLEIIEDQIKEVYNNIVYKKIFSSGNDLIQRIIIYQFIEYVQEQKGFVFSKVAIGGWDPVICLLTKDPLERRNLK